MPATVNVNALALKTGTSNAGVVIKAQGGSFQAKIYNPNASEVYLQCFDAVAPIVVGTTAPSFVIPIKASGTEDIDFPVGFAKGLIVAATTGATGNTAPSTGLDCFFALS